MISHSNTGWQNRMQAKETRFLRIMLSLDQVRNCQGQNIASLIQERLEIISGQDKAIKP